MTLDALLVFDPTTNVSVASGNYRRMLVQALEARGCRVVLATPSDISAAHDGTEPDLLVVEVGAADAIAGRHLDLDTAWFLVLPTADRRSPEGADWVAQVRGVATTFPRARFLVDSEEGRDQIEGCLSSRRVEVMVVPRRDPERLDAWIPTDVAALHAAGAPARWNTSAAELYSGPVDTSLEAAPGGPATERALDLLVATRRPVTRDVDLAILGANLNFVHPLAQRLSHGHLRSVETQEWKFLSAPTDVERAQHLLDTADTVLAEWIRPSAKWIQEHAPAETRLIVRGHRYEVTTDFPNMVDMTRYSAAVVITPWVGRELVQKFRWPAEKIVYIPNFVDSRYFDRPKLPGAQFALGVVGIRPALKRVDLALDLLLALRKRDLRYHLRIRSANPFDSINWAKEGATRAQWHETLARVKNDPLLRGAVFFDAPGQDMSTWLRQIGVILSLSDIEGSHVALAEGLASGALGVARRWPGIRGLWPEEIIHDSLDSAVGAILSVREDGALAAQVPSWQRTGSLDVDRVVSAWKDLVAGDVEAARAAFGPIDASLDINAPHDLP